MEEKIGIQAGGRVIEGLLSVASPDTAVVISHPHSLMGGSMYNNVVEAIQQAFAAEQVSTLRFNFRGVGASSGHYEEGVGEQKDVRTVCAYLKNRGMSRLYFAGYSFGAWVGANVIGARDNPFTCSILVSPPIDYFDFDWDSLKDRVRLMICGDADSFCDADELVKQARRINAEFKMIPGADHFYVEKEAKLISVLRENLGRQADKKK